MTVVAEEAADDEDAAPAVSCAAAVVVISSLIARQVRRMSSSSSLYSIWCVEVYLTSLVGVTRSPRRLGPSGVYLGLDFQARSRWRIEVR